jgi:hypothetical protein
MGRFLRGHYVYKVSGVFMPESEVYNYFFIFLTSCRHMQSNRQESQMAYVPK